MRGTRAAGRRLAFYSHDTMGLGHMRRNLLLAETLARTRVATDILVIAGSTEAAIFGARRGLDCVTLPSLQKVCAGSYRSRHLNIPLTDLVTVRSATIRAAIDAFDPDLFIVDNVPRGAEGELNRTLAMLRRGGRTRIVLGLRDVLDAPEVVRSEWRRARNEDAIRQYYDAVWVYGDRAVYDMPREYGFAPDVAAKIHYAGYIDQRSRLARGEHTDETAFIQAPYVLCMVGGGQDGAALARVFADSEPPAGMRRVLLTGPHMDPAERCALAARAARDRTLHVFEFLPEPMPLVARAACVVAMGGYNTVCEILSLARPSVIVPRVTPRAEQWIRAQRLHTLGLVDLLHPADLRADTLADRIAAAIATPRPATTIDFDGLSRVSTFTDDLMYEGQERSGGAPPRLPRHAVL